MADGADIRVVCGKCETGLKAKADLAGKTVKCPKCGGSVTVPGGSPERDLPKAAPLATEKQKDFARSLGIEFGPSITRPEISKLIDQALEKQDDERYQRLEDLSSRESEAYERLRKEVLADLSSDECTLSVAEPSQILEALSERGFASVLIQIPWDEAEDFEHLKGANAIISWTHGMTQEDMENVVLTHAYQVMRERGILHG